MLTAITLIFIYLNTPEIMNYLPFTAVADLGIFSVIYVNIKLRD